MSKPYDLEPPKSDLTVRERLTIVLVLFMIGMLKPWKYNHEQKEFYEDVYTLIGLRNKK